MDALGGTLYRDRRILKHLQPKAGAVTMEDIKDAFKDHFGYPLVFQIQWHHHRNKLPHKTLEASIPLRISDSLHQHNDPVPKIYGG